MKKHRIYTPKITPKYCYIVLHRHAGMPCAFCEAEVHRLPMAEQIK